MAKVLPSGLVRLWRDLRRDDGTWGTICRVIRVTLRRGLVMSTLGQVEPLTKLLLR